MNAHSPDSNRGTKLQHTIATSKGSASIAATDGQNVTLHADFPSPPGSPLIGVLVGTEHELRVKVHGCRRLLTTPVAQPGAAAEPTTPENRFEITGRWVSLSRVARLLILGETG